MPAKALASRTASASHMRRPVKPEGAVSVRSSTHSPPASPYTPVDETKRTLAALEPERSRAPSTFASPRG